MFSPYINTKLYTNVILNPNQMNNNIYLNLKKNLTDMIEKKCFGDYGYIVEVFNILEYDNAVIEAESTTASSTYDVIFTCRLCKPIKNKVIICEVNNINPILIKLTNGPLVVIITDNRINYKKFFRDTNKNIRYKKDNVSVVLNDSDFVKVTIVQYTFNSGDDKIVALGFLEDMAYEDDIKQFYEDEYSNNDDNNLVKYSEYVKED